jgi:hypothetical protein
LAQEPKGEPVSIFPAGYRTHEALATDVKRIASEHPELVRVMSLGRSLEGREILMVRVGRPEQEKVEPHPAILIVGNLEADHLVGSEIATRLIERIAQDAATDPEVASLLDHWTVYVVPRLNPDGAERLLRAGPRVDQRGNARPLDRDRDGRAGEDGPDDLDGDGLALTMRVKDDRATLIADEKDDRILKPAEIAKSQTPLYSLYREGSDDDGDGLIDEDPPAGVNLNRNWPHKWPEFDLEAGYSPGGEPETRPLIRFIVDHPEVVALLNYGIYDTVSSEPKKPGSTLDDADLPFFVELARNYAARSKEASQAPSQAVALAQPDEPAPAARAKQGRQAAPTRPGSASTALPNLEASPEGSLCEWAYQQLGLVALSTRLWTLPELPEPAEGQPKLPVDGDARWLYWNDNITGGLAFVPFKPFDHPTLGPVEIGGWKPGVRLNPPSERLAPIAAGQLAFLKDVVARLPRLDLVDAKVTPKGDGVFEVTAAVTNAGTFPTALAQGLKARSSPPVVVRLRAPNSRILAGKPLIKFDSVRGLGGKLELRWLLQAPEDAGTIEIEAGNPRAGHARKTLPLR